MFLHPEPGAARSAAQRLGPVTGHLHHLYVAGGCHHLPGRQVDVVVPPQIAGIVIGDPPGFLAAVHRSVAGGERSPPQQFGQQLRVVYHLVVPAQLRVFVGQGVEAVRTLGDHLLNSQGVEGLDVLEGQLLVDELVSSPTGGIPVAHLPGAEHREVDSRRVHEPGQRQGDRPVAVIEGTGASHEPQVFGGVHPVRSQHLHRKVQLPGPVEPLLLPQPPGIALVLHGHEGLGEFGGKVGLHQRQVAAHVENLVEDLDIDRTDVIAGSTRGARPHLLGGDSLEQVVGVDGDGGGERNRGGHHRIARGGQHLTRLDHDLPWVERLAGDVGRTHRRAPAADRACVGVEQLLPAEVAHRGRADGLQVLGLHQVGHGFHRSLDPLPGREEHVDRGGDGVTQLGHGKHHQKRQEGGGVDSPHHLMEELRRRRHQKGERVAHKGPLLEVGLAVHRDPRRLGHQSGDAHQNQEAQHQAVLGTGLGSDAGRGPDVAAEHRPRQPSQENQGEEVQDRRVPEVDGTMQELPGFGHEVIDLEGDGPGQQHQEPVIDHGVHEARGGVAEQGLHAQAVGQVPHPPFPLPDTLFGTTSRPVASAEGEQIEGQPQEGGHRDVEGGLQPCRNVPEDLPSHFPGRLRMHDRAQPPQGHHPHRRNHPQGVQHLRGIHSLILLLGLGVSGTAPPGRLPVCPPEG